MSKMTVHAKGSGSAAAEERQWRQSVTVEWFEGDKKVRRQEYFDVKSLDELIAELEAQGVDAGEVKTQRDRLQDKFVAQRKT